MVTEVWGMVTEAWDMVTARWYIATKPMGHGALEHGAHGTKERL